MCVSCINKPVIYAGHIMGLCPTALGFPYMLESGIKETAVFQKLAGAHAVRWTRRVVPTRVEE